VEVAEHLEATTTTSSSLCGQWLTGPVPAQVGAHMATRSYRRLSSSVCRAAMGGAWCGEILFWQQPAGAPCMFRLCSGKVDPCAEWVCKWSFLLLSGQIHPYPVYIETRGHMNE
jgi:hypothetical protein